MPTTIDRIPGQPTRLRRAFDAIGDAFVPYIGAIKNVDLGTFDLTTTGTLTADTFTDGTFTATSGDFTGMGDIDGADVDITAGTGDYTTSGLGTFGNLDVDTLNLNGNSITDSTGTISFDNENLTTIGIITGEHLVSTDDAVIADLLTVLRIKSHADLTSDGDGTVALGTETPGSGTAIIDAGGIGNIAMGLAQGGTNTDATIQSTDNGAFAMGFAQSSDTTGGNAQIKALGNGSMAFGVALGQTDQRAQIWADDASGSGNLAMGHAVGGAGVGLIYASGKGTVAMGYANGASVSAIGDASFAHGENVSVSQNNAYAFGKDFTNTTASTYVVGFGAGQFVINATEMTFDGKIRLNKDGSITDNYISVGIGDDLKIFHEAGNSHIQSNLNIELTSRDFINIAAGRNDTEGILYLQAYQSPIKINSLQKVNCDVILSTNGEPNFLYVDSGANWLRVGDWDTNYMQLSVTGGITFVGTAGLVYGTCYGNHIGWSQANAVEDTWYNISDADMLPGPLQGVTHDGNGKLTVTEPGMYMVNYSVCFENDVANDHVEAGIEVSGSGSANAAGICHLENKFANEEEHMSSSTILDLADNATLEIAIRTTDSGTPTISIHAVNLTCVQVGGT